MSLHRKATYRIVNLRSALTTLRATARQPSHLDALNELIRRADDLIAYADEALAPPTKVQAMASRGAYDFAAMSPGDTFDVEPERVSSLRVAASTWGARHGVKLSVRSLPDGGARCIRVDGLAPRDIDALMPQALQPKPVHPVTQLRADNPPVRVRDELDDPETADDVRKFMDVPADRRTDWQQFVVDEYQHLIEFEHTRPPSSLILECVMAAQKDPEASPRVKWIAGQVMHLGWDTAEAGG